MHKYGRFVLSAFVFLLAVNSAFSEENSLAANSNSIELKVKILAVSAFPEPEKADYPDCYYTVKAALLDGSKDEICLIVPAFFRRKLADTANLKKDGEYTLQVIDYDALSQQQKSIQQADELQIFNLKEYFVLSLGRKEGRKEGSSGCQDK